VTVGEIEAGTHQALARAPHGDKPLALRRWLEDALIPRFDNRLLEVDLAVARTWGALTAHAGTNGTVVGAVDTLLAATAIAHGLTLVTRNTTDFRALPVATAVEVLLGVVLTVLVMFLAFAVRFSGGWPPPTPTTREIGRLPEWDLLLYSWLVSGTYLAAMVLAAVALGKMGSLPGVGVVLGVLLAIAGLVGGPTRYELFIAPLGAAVSVASALARRADAADAARRGKRAE
jgi:predicted nucleic acid-binding protein